MADAEAQTIPVVPDVDFQKMTHPDMQKRAQLKDSQLEKHAACPDCYTSRTRQDASKNFCFTCLKTWCHMCNVDYFELHPYADEDSPAEDMKCGAHHFICAATHAIRFATQENGTRKLREYYFVYACFAALFYPLWGLPLCLWWAVKSILRRNLLWGVNEQMTQIESVVGKGLASVFFVVSLVLFSTAIWCVLFPIYVVIFYCAGLVFVPGKLAFTVWRVGEKPSQTP